MSKRRKFVPGQVGALEDRALLNGGGFRFPAVLGPVTTLNYRGANVLTSRTYADVQNTVNKAFTAFINDVSRAFHQLGDTPAFADKVGLGTLGPNGYAPGTLLAKFDSVMAGVERRLPYGKGLVGSTGGVGLSTLTAPTTNNAAVIALGGISVAEHLETVVATQPTLADIRVGVEQVRQATLNIVGNAPLAPVDAVPGFLATYVQQFGPGGAGYFGLSNGKTHAKAHDKVHVKYKW